MLETPADPAMVLHCWSSRLFSPGASLFLSSPPASFLWLLYFYSFCSRCSEASQQPWLAHDFKWFHCYSFYCFSIIWRILGKHRYVIICLAGEQKKTRTMNLITPRIGCNRSLASVLAVLVLLWFCCDLFLAAPLVMPSSWDLRSSYMTVQVTEIVGSYHLPFLIFGGQDFLSAHFH